MQIIHLDTIYAKRNRVVWNALDLQEITDYRLYTHLISHILVISAHTNSAQTMTVCVHRI